MTVKSAKKLHLAIDFDEVLFPLEESLALYHNQTYATRFLAEDLRKAYEYHLVWGGTRRQANAKVADFRSSAIHAATKPMEGSARAIESLAGRFRITIITARGPTATAPTTNWIERWLPAQHISDVIFTGNEYERDFIVSKTAVCKNIGVHYLIDDAMRYLREAHRSGIKTIKFGHDPYDDEPIEEGMLWAAGWKEVTKLLLKDAEP